MVVITLHCLVYVRTYFYNYVTALQEPSQQQNRKWLQIYPALSQSRLSSLSFLLFLAQSPFWMGEAQSCHSLRDFSLLPAYPFCLPVCLAS